MELTASFRNALDREPNITVVLDAAWTIRCLNLAWTQSLERGDAPESCRAEAVLGRPYLSFITGPLKDHLAHALARAAAQQKRTASVWLFGECNTPRLYRRLTTRISALWADGADASNGLIVHSILDAVGPLSEHYVPVVRSLDAFRQPNGVLSQCGCCRRVREVETGAWVMSLDLLAHPAPDTSHGLCELCLETYYGEPLVSDEPPRA